MAYETIVIETRGRFCSSRSTGHRRSMRLNTQLAAELIDAVVAADAAPEIGCIVVTGSAKAFAAGCRHQGNAGPHL